MSTATIFIKDARLRPLWRAIVYSVAVPVGAVLLFELYRFITGQLPSGALTLSDVFGGEVVTAISALLVALVLRRYVDRRSIASLGIAPRGPWLQLFSLGVLFGAGMQAVAFVVLVAVGAAHVVGHASPASDVRALAPTVAFFFAAAFLEEMSFRGYLLQNFWEEWGIVPAVLVTSFAFALVHGSNPHAREQTLLTLAGLLVFALWVCMSVVWTKSLWPALGAHLAWNVVEGPILGLPVSGVIMPLPTVLRESVSGPAWLTGGAFGPEAGASSLVAMATGFAALWWLYAKGSFARVADTREAYARASGSSGLSKTVPARSESSMPTQP